MVISTPIVSNLLILKRSMYHYHNVAGLLKRINVGIRVIAIYPQAKSAIHISIQIKAFLGMHPQKMNHICLTAIMYSWHYNLSVLGNKYVRKTRLVLAANALAHCVTRPSAALVLIIGDKRVCVFHEHEFQPILFSTPKKSRLSFVFSPIDSAHKSWCLQKETIPHCVNWHNWK